MPDDAAQPAQPARPAGGSSSTLSGPTHHEPGPATSILDPRALQILSAEHSSLLSARSLAYNESFTRGAMFLAFVSMSFVAVALVAQALPIDRDFLSIAALALAFDLVVGLTTYGRIISASYEDYRAVHGMARIRHGYGEIAPVVLPYFTTGVHDDLAGVMLTYAAPTVGPAALVYQLTTSSTMIGLIVSMVAGILGLVVALIIGTAITVAFIVAAVVAIGLFLALAAATVRFYMGVQAKIQVAFPTPSDGAPRA